MVPALARGTLCPVSETRSILTSKTSSLLAGKCLQGEGWSPCIFYRTGLLQLLESNSSLYHHLPKALTHFFPANFCMPFSLWPRWNKCPILPTNLSALSSHRLYVFIPGSLFLSPLSLFLSAAARRKEGREGRWETGFISFYYFQNNKNSHNNNTHNNEETRPENL